MVENRFIYIVRFIFRHKAFSLFKILSLCAGLISAILVWLYAVEYNQKVIDYGDMFDKCTLADFLSVLTILVVMCASYLMIVYNQRNLCVNQILIRKVYGDRAIAIAFDVMLETSLFIIFSFALSLVIIDQLVPFLNQITNRGVWLRGAAGFLLHVYIFCFLVIVWIACGILPAYLYAKMKPVDILNKKTFKSLINS